MSDEPQNLAYLSAYDVDRRSLFVGNLGEEITELHLMRVFEKFGEILKINVHQNDSVIEGKHFESQPKQSLTPCSGSKALLCLRRV